MKKPSKERRERIIKYAKEHAGISVGELAEIFVLSEVQAVGILKEAGMFKEAEGKAKKAPGFSWDEDAVFRLKAYLVQGMKNAEIAKNLGCKPQAVADYKKRHREELRGYIGNGAHEVYDRDIDGAKRKPSAESTEGDSRYWRNNFGKGGSGRTSEAKKEEPLTPRGIRDSGGVPDAGVGGVRGTAPGTEGVGRNPSDENYYSTDSSISQDTVCEISGTEGENDMDKKFEEILESTDEGSRENTDGAITGGSDVTSEEAYEKWLRKYMDAECKAEAARENVADAMLLLGALQVVLDEEVVYDSPCGAFTFGTSGKERFSFLISREAIRLLREADGSLFEI